MAHHIPGDIDVNEVDFTFPEDAFIQTTAILADWQQSFKSSKLSFLEEAIHLNNFEYHLHKNALCQVCLKSVQWF